MTESNRSTEARSPTAASSWWARRSRSALRVVIVVLAVTGLAAGSAITVNQTSLTTLYAEHYKVQDGIAVGPSQVWPTNAALPAAGTDGAPVTFAVEAAEARTPLAEDHWIYSVFVKETAAGSAKPGNYTVELLVNGASVGKIYVAKRASDAPAESVRASFDVGPAFAGSTLFYVIVEPLVRSGPIVDFTIVSQTPAESSLWIGSGGAIEGKTNPTLAVPLGATLRLTAKFGEGASSDIAHNLGVKNSAGTVVAGWSADIDNSHSTVVLLWTPSAAGTYSYVCKYHAKTQLGPITVS